MRERSSPTGITGGHRIRGVERCARDDLELAIVHESQQRRAARDVFAGLTQALGHDAGKRCAHRGTIEIEPGAIARHPRLLQVLLGHALARLRFVELALRHHALSQRLQTLALRGEQLQLRVEPFHGGFVVAERQREPLRIETRDGFATPDDRAGFRDPGERPLDFAGDARIVAAHDRAGRRKTRTDALRAGGCDDDRNRWCIGGDRGPRVREDGREYEQASEFHRASSGCLPATVDVAGAGFSLSRSRVGSSTSVNTEFTAIPPTSTVARPR
jgi:hypothetical protein